MHATNEDWPILKEHYYCTYVNVNMVVCVYYILDANKQLLVDKMEEYI